MEKFEDVQYNHVGYDGVCYDIVMLGGDKRSAYMVPLLEANGLKVLDCQAAAGRLLPKNEGLTFAAAAQTIVCGIPLFKGKHLNGSAPWPEYTQEEFLQALSKGQRLFAGAIPQEFVQKCEAKGVACYDFMKEETIAVFNAVATAEGAVLEALTGTERNLHKSSCLVLGYGRCAKVLSDKLKGLSAQVTVVSREEEERTWAEALGFEAVNFEELPKRIGNFDFLFNTVPAMVLDAELLKKMKQDALIIDIASAAGGVDYEKAEERNIAAKHCPGLPGRYKSKASAKPLAEYVLRSL